MEMNELDENRGDLELAHPGEQVFTLESAVEKIGVGKFQVYLMIAAGFVWLSDAMEMMLLSIIAPTLKCVWHLSTFEEAFITTVVFVGMGLGCTFWGFVCDKFGRKKGVILSSVFVLYFGGLSSQAPSYPWILVIRLMVGFSIGGSPQVATIVTEFLPSKSRGQCIILLEVFWAIGSLFAVTLALVVMDTLGWRYYLFFSTFPSLIFLLIAVWLPESPRYLLTAGQPEEALDVLKRAARINGATLPDGVLYNPNIKVQRGKLSDLMSKEWRQLTCLLWVIWIASAFSYYGILLLTTEMFETHISGCHPHGIMIAYFMVDIIGRKLTLSATLFLASCFFCCIAFCTSRTISLVFVFAVRGLVTCAFQTAYVYTPEVFPTSMRALAVGTCSSSSRIGAMITPFVAQVLLQSSLYYGVGVYAAVLLCSAIATLLLPYDTKGRSLEDTTVDNGKLGYNRIK